MTFLIVCVSVFIGIIIGVAQVIRAKEIMENYSTVTSKTKRSPKADEFRVYERVMVKVKEETFTGYVMSLKKECIVLLIELPNNKAQLAFAPYENVFKMEEHHGK